MKTYKVPVTYQSVMYITVQAQSIEEAAQKAEEEFMAIPDEQYLFDSMQIDEEDIFEL